ncbi:MAG: hypothetical protein HYZ83_08405, partial [Candidatus Omnitrophica bacterium]|nr:hypothetical protein [Candidatus Omnitrophota bacterium]
MKKIRLWILAFFGFFCLSLFPSHVSAFSIAYEQTIWVNGNQVAAFKVATKDGRLRVETNLNGIPSIMLRNETGYYNYTPSKNKAIQIPKSMQRPNLADSLPHYEEFLKRNRAEKIGTESVRGYETNVYKFMDPDGLGETKVWLWIVRPIPVKIERIGNQGLMIIEISRLELDAPFGNTFFELPIGTEI